MADDQIFRFIEAIKERLFKPEERRLQMIIDQLVEKSEAITRATERGFLYNGTVYRHSRSNIAHRSYPAIAWELVGEMEQWTKDKRQVELDKAQIGQLLFKLQSAVMPGSQNQKQEMRDALPDCLVPLVPAFQGMQRICNVDFYMKDMGRDMRQYQRLLPKIEMYAVAGLIY